MQIFIKDEEVPEINKVESTQHGELSVGEPVIAAGSETPGDPDAEEDFEEHISWLLEDCNSVGLVCCVIQL